MKSKDQQLLEEAYLKVASQKDVIEEKNFRSIAAGAALGLATLAGLQGNDKGMTPDDQADRSMIAQTNSPEMTILAKAQEAYEAAIEMIHANQPLPEKMLKAIAADKNTAERCAHLMVLKGIELPKELRAVVGDVDKVMKSSLMGP